MVSCLKRVCCYFCTRQDVAPKKTKVAPQQADKKTSVAAQAIIPRQTQAHQALSDQKTRDRVISQKTYRKERGVYITERADINADTNFLVAKEFLWRFDSARQDELFFLITSDLKIFGCSERACTFMEQTADQMLFKEFGDFTTAVCVNRLRSQITLFNQKKIIPTDFEIELLEGRNNYQVYSLCLDSTLGPYGYYFICLKRRLRIEITASPGHTPAHTPGNTPGSTHCNTPGHAQKRQVVVVDFRLPGVPEPNRAAKIDIHDSALAHGFSSSSPRREDSLGLSSYDPVDG